MRSPFLIPLAPTRSLCNPGYLWEMVVAGNRLRPHSGDGHHHDGDEVLRARRR